ncbi:MAG TPA: 3D domain-containing protein [Candidatus Hydrogenedentes bacterium]|nr:3D domain-containing protein [Candidatus Hydrogenedentota bacterium]HPO85227.1 3D domain-containing protein [Candidatus Hydrogenedentota bacterium]
MTMTMYIGKTLRLVAAVILASSMLFGCATIRPPKGARYMEKTMETTGYCPCKKCTGWRRTWYGKPVYAYGPNEGKYKPVGVTASGTKARKGTIAADTTVFPFGTIMFIPGYGYGRVEDRGSAITNDHIDLFFRRHSDAVKWGKQVKPVRIWLPQK